MASSAITLRIALDGASAVKAQLDAIAAAGARSMALLSAAGGAGAAGLASVGAAVARVREASAAIGSVGVGTATAAGIESIGQAIKRTGEEFAGTEVAGQGLISLFDEFQRGQRGQMFATLGASIKRAGESWEGLTIGVVAATGAFFAFSKSAAEATREIQDQAAALGTTVEHFEGLKYAAASLGIGQDVLSQAMARLGDAAGRAKVQGERLAEQQHLHADDSAALALKQDELRTSIEEAGLAAERSARQFRDASDPLTGLVANADRGVEAAQRALTRAREAAFSAYGSTSISPTEESIYSTSADRARNDAALRITSAEHAVAEAERRAAQARQHIADLAREQQLAQEKAAQAEAQKRQEARQKQISDEQRANPIQRAGVGLLQQAMGEIAPGASGLPDMYRLLGTVADALDAIQNPAERSAAAMHLFGEQWVKLDPLLRLGTAGLDQAAERFKSFGLELTPVDQAMAGRFNVAMGELGQVVESLKNQVGDQMAGAFAPFIEGLAAALVRGKDQIMAFASTVMALFAPMVMAIRQAAAAVGQALNMIAAV
ncbi:MAG TPA: hypothetical protein VNF04_06470, partial [Stellaceae bacterium]|nr:hypothetical protein [Stellaceae bacterium]